MKTAITKTQDRLLQVILAPQITEKATLLTSTLKTSSTAALISCLVASVRTMNAIC